MNRIESAFAELENKGEKALVTFVTAGDPDLETTEKLVLEMFENGSDIVEIGVRSQTPLQRERPFRKPVCALLQTVPILQKFSERSKTCAEKPTSPYCL